MSDELLIKYIQGGCTEEESRAILSWIEENDENKTRYKELMLICSLTDFYMPSYQKEKKQVSWIKIAIGYKVMVIKCGDAAITHSGQMAQKDNLFWSSRIKTQSSR